MLQITLEALKKQLCEPPVLAAPIDKEPILLYIAAKNKAVSVAVVVECKEAKREYGVQWRAYYISEVLTESYYCGQLSPIGRHHPK